jgi:arylsulfatase A-like enzyme
MCRWFLILLLGCPSSVKEATSVVVGERREEAERVVVVPVDGQVGAGAPNILLISLDTVRPDHTSAYGYSKDTTPLLARYAAEGAVFEHAYAQAPSTSPTHASMFTGLYPSTHGYYSYKYRLASEHNTLAEILKSAGYRTFGVASSVKFVQRTGLQQGFDKFDRIGGPKNARSAQVNEKTIRYMKTASDQPFFGFIHYFDAHAPYAAPEPYRNKWHPALSHPKPEWTSRFIKKNRRNRLTVNPMIAGYLAGLYDGELSYLDTFLGQLLAAVPQTKKRSTLVVVTSDHGEAFFEHRYLGHSHVLYEEIMRVPLVVWWPGKVAPGQRMKVPTQTVDLVPTLLELVGIPVPSGLEGRSLAAPLLGAGPEPKSVPLFLQSPKFFGLIEDLPTGRFKLTVRLKNQRARLVNLTADPEGKTNLVESQVSELNVMKQRISSLPFQDPRGRSVERDEFDDAELLELKALGYIE